jgi:predicted nucleic acid-binding protein
VIVIDASVLVPALVDDSPGGDAIRSRLRDEQLVAPALIAIEVMHATRRAAFESRLDERRARQALVDLMAAPVRQVPHGGLLPRMWALRHDMTPYDAAYVALAEAIGAPLLTADRRLAGSRGCECEVELIG